MLSRRPSQLLWMSVRTEGVEMDLCKYLSKGDQVTVDVGDNVAVATVKRTSVIEFERRYLLSFADGTEKWVNQFLVKTLLTKN